jgi:RNA polymerase sigma-70 factor
MKKNAGRFTQELTRLDVHPDVPTIAPETLFAQRHYVPVLNTAIREAIAALPDGPREILHSYYVDGLTIDELAERHGIHRATAARRVHSAGRLIMARVRELAAARLGVPDAEMDSLIGLVASRLEVSLRALDPSVNRSPDDGQETRG